MKVELRTITRGVGEYKDFTPEQIIATIARHGVIKKDSKNLITHLMENRHWSPLEMINYTFEIETSRAISLELVRHKSISFQQLSQRYQKDVKFEPIELRMEHPTNRQSSTEIFDPLIDTCLSDISASILIKSHLRATIDLYRNLIKAGVAKECARFILPEATTTILTANGSLRSWLSFLNVRHHKDAQKEMQNIAHLIGVELEKQLPNVMKVINWRDGWFM